MSLRSKLITSIALALLFILAVVDGKIENTARSTGISTTSSYWIDNSGTSSIDDAKRQTYQSFENTLNLGYEPQTIWVKISIKEINNNEPIGINISPTFLEKITIYETDENQRYTIQSKGRSQPAQSLLDEGIYFSFNLQNNTSHPREIFVKISTSTSMIFSYHVETLKKLKSENGKLTIILISCLSLTLLTGTWGLIQFKILKDSIYLYFAFRQVYAALHIFCLYGLTRYFITDESSKTFFNFVYNLTILSVVFILAKFEINILKQFNALTKAIRVAKILLYLQIITNIGLWIFKDITTALHFNNISDMFFIALLLGISLSAKTNPNSKKRNSTDWTIYIGYTLATTTVLFAIIGYSGLTGTGRHWQHYILAHPLIISIVMMIMLSNKSLNQQRQAYEIAQKEQVTREHLRLEKIRREENEHFLSMLIHELRSPLSVINLYVDSKHNSHEKIKNATQSINQVLDQVLANKMLDEREGEKPAVRTVFSISDVIEKYINTNDTHKRRFKTDYKSSTEIISDPTATAYIFKNIIDNALKYSPADSLIDIRSDIHHISDKEFLCITIDNLESAAGVPDLSKLFTKYYRSSHARRQTGAGLGLHLVKSWVTMLNGFVDCTIWEDEYKRNHISFRVGLPL